MPRTHISTAARSPRQARQRPLPMSERKFNAYLLARETLRRVRALAEVTCPVAPPGLRPPQG